MSSTTSIAKSPADVKVVARVVFWWDGYDPIKAMGMFSSVPVEEMTFDKGWGGSRPVIQDLGELQDWMDENNVMIWQTARIGQRRRPGVGWEGRYRVLLVVRP